MKYSLTFTETDFAALTEHLFDGATTERGAYLLCRRGRSSEDFRFLVREVIPVLLEDIESASPTHMKIRSRSFLRAMKRADEKGESFVFVHSHPDGFTRHSPQDDREEAPLFATAYNRIHNEGPHVSLVFSARNIPVGRVWLVDGRVVELDRVRVIGRRFHLFDAVRNELPIPEFFDRQVRAFGPDVQRLLQRLTIGVAGAGGTGSAVIQQLTRLGVGRLIVSDGELFDKTNINRVYGSRVSDQGEPKTGIVERSLEEIGLGTSLRTISKPITFQSVLREFLSCDAVFGCTDDEWGRSLLTKVAVYYLIPVFDIAVKIDSDGGTISSIQGRVTTLLPGKACLFCRGRLSPGAIAAQQMQALNPDQAKQLRKEGYVPELEEPAPAVIPFTTAVASSAVTELLHRLTGFLGDDRDSSEVIHRFDDTRLSTNDRPPTPECFCGNAAEVGRGDTNLFLNVTWRPE
jgi:molybdopterin/thiamine biosynthesis adenylyltransferase